MSERIGPYEIISQIGEGGMGNVYRAVDTRLDRTVAIKRLKSGFGERFEREARAISALNHPHIATLHDVGADYLVMEYVDGKLLAGPLPLDKALEYGRQVLSALEAAHRLGIIHRDLKPANILVTKAGVKLLDFGLAKMRPKASAATAEHTVTLALTGEHTIVGTPQYMAPEQIEGREADARSDIFAFGCVLYELLTGTRAFDGKSASSVMAAVLAAEPRPLKELVPVAPERLDKVLRACLAKDPDCRWQTATDLRRELDWLTPSDARAVVTRRSWIAHAGIAAAAGTAGYFVHAAGSKPDSRPAPVQRFRVPLTHPVMAGRIRIARNGERFFYLALGRNVERISRTIVVCDLDGSPPRAIGDARLANSVLAPAPDGKHVAFATLDSLLRVAARGGDPQVIAKGQFQTGEWTDEGLILCGARDSVVAVPATGGEPRVLARVAGGATYSGAIQMLPGGNHLLVVLRRGETRSVAIQDISGGAPRIIGEGQTLQYLRSGHLLYRRGSTWHLLPFDAKSMQKAGAEVAVPAGEIRDGVDVDDAGTLITSVAESATTEIRIVQADGQLSAPLGVKAGFETVNVSPDGKSVLLATNTQGNIWVLDMVRGTQTRLTFGEPREESPVWSPDGKQFAWRHGTDGGSMIHVKAADGSGAERLLYRSASHDHVESWSPDGRFLLVDSPVGIPGIFVVSVATGEKRPFFETKFYHRHAQFSPDGRWVAYTSDESGRNEVYVRAFPGPGGKWQISTEGGGRPRWSSDGKTIYYVAGGHLMAVAIQARDAITAGTPRKLMEQTIGEFDVLPGGRFIALTTLRAGAQEVLVTTNFFERARQLAPRSS